MATPNSKRKQDSNNDNDNAPTTQINSLISNSELTYILQGCKDDFRVDGRSCVDMRPYSIVSSSSSSTSSSSSSSLCSWPSLAFSNGSSRVSLPGGATDVICSVRAEIGRPSFSKPLEGVVDIHVDTFSPNNDLNHKRRSDSMELSQILSRLVLPHALSHTSLCIVPSRYCWKLNIDVLILAEDGCVVDVASMAMCRALNSTVLPVVKPIAKHDPTTTTTIMEPTSLMTATKPNSAGDDFVMESSDVAHAMTPKGVENCPLVLTVCILQQPTSGTSTSTSSSPVMVMDARSEEELCATNKVSVAVDRTGMICGVLQFGGTHSSSSTAACVPYKMLSHVTDLAVQASKAAFQTVLLSQDGNSSTTHKEEDGTTTTAKGMSNLVTMDGMADFLHGCFMFR